MLGAEFARLARGQKSVRAGVVDRSGDSSRPEVLEKLDHLQALVNHMSLPPAE
jgi:hypothetical protein